MLKSRKGISPILATLLLIVIAVAAISVSYAWIMTYMNNANDKAGVSLYEANAFFNSTSTTITLDIGNSGTSNAVITAIYVGSSPSTMSQVTYTSSTSTITANGAPVSFVISGQTWTPGTSVYFKVVPSSGSALTFDVKP
jgi:flagellin-like protein